MHEPFPGAVNLVLPCATFVAGLVTKGFIENKYARSIESLKSSLKRQENDIEGFRSRLDSSRGVIFSRSSARIAIIEQKRFDNAEALWNHYVALTPFRALEFVAKALDFEKMMEAASRADHEAGRMKEFASTMLGFADGAQAYLDSRLGVEANKLELFADDGIWEIFQIYRSAVMLSFMKLKLISMGIDSKMMKKPTDLIDKTKQIFPEFEGYISENGENALPYLYVYVERKLISMLKGMFGTKTSDDVASVNEINQAINLMKLQEMNLPRVFANTASKPVA